MPRPDGNGYREINAGPGYQVVKFCDVASSAPPLENPIYNQVSSKGKYDFLLIEQFGGLGLGPIKVNPSGDGHYRDPQNGDYYIRYAY